MIRHNKNISIVLVILVIIGVIVAFKLINKKVSPIMEVIAQEECKKFAVNIINDAVKKQAVEGLTFDKLFIITYDDDNNIAAIDFDSVIVNKVLSTITSTIQTNLKYIEQGNLENLELTDNILIHYDKNKLREGIIYEIPLSVIYDNVFLANLSPKVPVRISLIGNINSNIRTKVTDYGINNALIEVYIDIEVDLQVILPFQPKKVTTKTSVPLAIKMIRGNVPTYYGGLNSSFSVPIN